MKIIRIIIHFDTYLLTTDINIPFVIISLFKTYINNFLLLFVTLWWTKLINTLQCFSVLINLEFNIIQLVLILLYVWRHIFANNFTFDIKFLIDSTLKLILKVLHEYLDFLLNHFNHLLNWESDSIEYGL